MRAWQLLVTALVGCGPAANTVPFRLDAMETAAPAFPQSCSDEATEAKRRWLVFVQEDCTTCKAWLRQLEGERATLDAAGVAVEVVVVGRGTCAEAMRVAGGFPFPRRAAGARDEDAWQVTSTPITYRLESGTVRGRLEGKRPLATLRAAGWL